MVITTDSPDCLERLIRVLSEGGVAIAPGDTMYGLIGVAPGTEDRIRRIKGRGEDKPFLQLIADPAWTARFSDFQLPGKIARHWPGPLTVVVPDRAGGTLAVRMPDSDFLLRVLKGVQRPLYSTSVNRAGSPPLQTVAQMRRDFEPDVDLIVDAGDRAPGAPSTLLDLTVKPYRVLRRGALSLSPEDLA